MALLVFINLERLTTVVSLQNWAHWTIQILLVSRKDLENSIYKTIFPAIAGGAAGKSRM